MRGAFLVVLLLGAGLAGCLSNDPAERPDAVPQTAYPGFAAQELDAHGMPVPVPLCLPLVEGEDPLLRPLAPAGQRCNHEMTPDEGRQGNEVTIAVNPKDPRNIVGGAKDYYPQDAGDCVWDGIYVTHDGGRTTYEDRSMDGSPWRQLDDPDPSKVNYATQFWCTTDPVAYFDVNGELYYLMMAYQADPVTGSKTGEDELPMGGLNDWAFNRAVQIVAISSDGGDSFHTLSPVLEGSFPVAFHDKGWLAASDDGTVHVGWLAFVEGNVYFRSTDGGQTWSDPVLMAPFVSDGDNLGVGGGQGTFVDVGPGPEVYYSWAGGGGVALRRSLDRGATWDEARVVQDMERTCMRNGIEDRDRRDLQFPALATDRNPDSPYAGGVYFAFQDGREGTCPDAPDSSIFFTASHDGGETFTDAVKISGPDDGAFQLFPAVSVSPGGVIDVTWLDLREDPEGVRISQYYTYSLDGGATWSEPYAVRDIDDGGWDPALSHHQNGMVFIGDYIDIDSSWQAAHPVWPDTRSGEVVDVYTATLQRPLFAEGWSLEDIEALLPGIESRPL